MYVCMYMCVWGGICRYDHAGTHLCLSYVFLYLNKLDDMADVLRSTHDVVVALRNARGCELYAYSCTVCSMLTFVILLCLTCARVRKN